MVSAIIVNWNHGTFLPACLQALQADGRRLLSDGSLEILVVDNGSTDGSPEWLARHYPGVRLLKFPDNRGFSHALNHGIRNTNGLLVLSLNPDVVVRPGFLQSLLESMVGIGGAPAATAAPGTRIGMAAPKLLRADAPTTLDSTGLLVDRRRRPHDRGQGELDRGQYDMQREVFGPCGAAALYRRDMLQDLADTSSPPEPFDEQFFAYVEDADLAWRAQLRGWHCAYVPTAVATHVRGWGDTLRKRGHARQRRHAFAQAPVHGGDSARGPRLALRNRYLMTIKNDAWRYTVVDLPLILAAELPRLAYAAFTTPRILLALPDLARALPDALRKRRRIRSRRTVADAALRRWFVASGSSPGRADRKSVR